MEDKIFRLFLYSILAAFSLPSLAAGFNVTTDFSRAATEGASGGGGCAGTLGIHQIVDRSKSIWHINGIYFGDTFIEDSQCDVTNKVVVSINGDAYFVYAATHKREYKDGFMSMYSNPSQDVYVSLYHFKTLRRIYDPNTECTTYQRMVKVVIRFKGEKKVVYGGTSGGCP